LILPECLPKQSSKTHTTFIAFGDPSLAKYGEDQVIKLKQIKPNSKLYSGVDPDFRTSDVGHSAIRTTERKKPEAQNVHFGSRYRSNHGKKLIFAQIRHT